MLIFGGSLRFASPIVNASLIDGICHSQLKLKCDLKKLFGILGGNEFMMEF
jgi:hypothetical protein